MNNMIDQTIKAFSKWNYNENWDNKVSHTDNRGSTICLYHFSEIIRIQPEQEIEYENISELFKESKYKSSITENLTI